MLRVILAVVFVSTLFTGSLCIEWSDDLENGETVYVCEGHDLTLPWKITPEADEEVSKIHWLLEGEPDKMIGLYTRDTFLTTPSYAQRARHVPNAGITVSHVTEEDIGSYRVEIHTKGKDSAYEIHKHTVVVEMTAEDCETHRPEL